MKNKKKKIGFTLIELLAVIIVLAIIALIATPIIFNVIENAKLKSLENSCYGVIDAVRTKYAEGLLNSEDGTVKLSGDVKDIPVSGEQPIEGTWEIDNSSDSDNRGIKIKDVKFGSMKDYTCTNVNSDGTINSKVTCTKGGSDDVVETDLSCFEYKDILDYDIDIDVCIKTFENTSPDGDTSVSVISHEEAIDICNGTMLYGFSYIDGLIDEFSLDSIKPFIDGGVVIPKTDFSINVDGCVTFLTHGEEVSDEELANIKGICNGEIPIEENIYIKDGIINEIASGNMTIEEVKQSGMVDVNSFQTRKILMKYTCDYKDIVIPEQTSSISGNAFSEKELTSVDFRKAKNLTTIHSGAFQNKEISDLDLSSATKLKTIGFSAFSGNKITSVKLPSSINVIGNCAFMDNKINSIDLGKTTSLAKIDMHAFSENKIDSLDLSSATKLKTIETEAFIENEISNIKLPNGLVNIVDYAFKYNKLKNVEIPNSVISIGSSTFSENPNLTSIKIDKENGSIEGAPWGASNATIAWKN